MFKLIVLVVFASFMFVETTENSLKENLIKSLKKVLDFMDFYYDELNIDAIFGLTLGEAHLTITYQNTKNIKEKQQISKFIQKCNFIKTKTIPKLPKTPLKMLLFQIIMLNAKNWQNELPKTFKSHQLENLGLYRNWTSNDILKDRKATYRGVATDFCLEELFLKSRKSCFVGPFCQEMMFGARNDTGYLLTHRLLYMQLINLIDCDIKNVNIEYYTNWFCSLIYKELKTSTLLNNPYHDKFLEQVLLCGQQGYIEILNLHWLKQILSWQEPQGCFKSIKNLRRFKRSSNIIEFGCSDHSTGLASGVLSLYLRFLSLL